MTPLALFALFGIALFLPAFMNDEDDAAETPVEPDLPEEPLEPEEPEEPLEPATAILDEATNTVTVTTDPEETGTILTVSNRTDLLNSDGRGNFVYRASIFLIPDTVDLTQGAEAAFDTNDSTFLSDILGGSGGTELGSFAFDPQASEGTSDAIPDFIYPEGIDSEFAQFYTINFGDGDQIEQIIDVAGEENLQDGIEQYLTSFETFLLEDNGGAIITTPTDFEGSLAILETITDFFFEGELVRTDVTVAVLSVAAGTNFTASAITLAEEVIQTPNSEGSDIATDGLTERELFLDVPGTEFQGSYGVSVTEFDTNGNVVGGRVDGGLGVSADIDIERFVVNVTAEATRGDGDPVFWNTTSFSGVVTSFGNIANTPPDTSEIISGTEGNDRLSSSGNDDDELFPLNGIGTLRGLAGDDVLIHSGSDSAGPLVLEGGEGNDTLLANEVEFRNATTLDGGAGDDILRTDIFVNGGSSTGVDTFITGEGSDRIEIITFNVSNTDSIDLGLAGVVTDFTPTEDMIFVDPSQLVREVFPQDGDNGGEDFIAEYEQEFRLREDTSGAFTDLEFTFTAIDRLTDGNPVQMTGVIRLEGLTGLTESDIAFAQLETQAPLFTRDGVSSGG